MKSKMIDHEALKAKYNPEGSKLRKNQLELLDMLQDLAKICEEHNIKWWLSSGTLLGAARHEGFIPWDDDVDIVMLRKDFNRLQKVLHKMDSEKYVYHSMRTDPEYVNFFGKFRKREGVVKTTIRRHQNLKYRGAFIDIFAIEKTSYFASRASKVVYYNLQHVTLYIKTKWLRCATIRLIEGFFIGLVKPILRLIGLINPRGEYHYILGSPWAKSTFFAKDIFPLTTAKFEGHKFPVPKDTNAYLTGVYGDWRELPSDEIIRRCLHNDEYKAEIYGTNNEE